MMYIFHHDYVTRSIREKLIRFVFTTNKVKYFSLFQETFTACVKAFFRNFETSHATEYKSMQ